MLSCESKTRGEAATHRPKDHEGSLQESGLARQHKRRGKGEGRKGEKRKGEVRREKGEFRIENAAVRNTGFLSNACSD